MAAGARLSACFPPVLLGRAKPATGRAGCWAELAKSGRPSSLVRFRKLFYFYYFTELMLDSKIHISYLVAPNDMVQIV
jgi:hypothetical protein